MDQYQKTDLGIQSLKQRSLNLNARQRRLLLLIGTDDFDLLSEQFKRRIAPPELLEQLIEMGLIHCPAIPHILSETSPHLLDTEIETHLPLQSAPPVQDQFAESISTSSSSLAITTETAVPQVLASNEMQTTLEVLDFEQVKQFMAQLLQRHCGLMAKQLINRILAANDLRSLKLCQMQWITALQESRLAPKDLNSYLNQINFSLQKLIS